MAPDTSLDNNPGVAFLEGLLAAIAISTLSAGQLDLGAAVVLACVVVLAGNPAPYTRLPSGRSALLG